MAPRLVGCCYFILYSHCTCWWALLPLRCLWLHPELRVPAAAEGGGLHLGGRWSRTLQVGRIWFDPTYTPLIFLLSFAFYHLCRAECIWALKISSRMQSACKFKMPSPLCLALMMLEGGGVYWENVWRNLCICKLSVQFRWIWRSCWYFWPFLGWGIQLEGA